MVRRVVAGVLVSTLLGCTTQGRDTLSTTGARTEAPFVVDAALGEQAFPDEPVLAEAIGAAIERSLRTRYASGAVLRDAHPKAHGCVRAEFRVAATLPPALAHGVFAPGATYPAWIRFSNGSQDATRPDIKGDARGMAIKLQNVPGTTLLGDDSQAGPGATQDFILISHPVFFANDPRRYLAVVSRASSDSAASKLLIPFDLGLRGALIAFETSRKRISHPLQTRYWSTVPYQLGSGPERQAVKYSVRACSAVVDPLPAQPTANFLRDRLRATLQAGDACMEFLVQPRTSADMSVEDSMVEWPEQAAPFHSVATLHIPRQAFDSTKQNAFCEALSFNPWHALPEHRPLGVTNRLRKVIYERISRVRAGRAAEVAKMDAAETINGESAPVKMSGSKLIIDGAVVTAPDIASNNGVLHGIDKVNIPTRH